MSKKVLVALKVVLSLDNVNHDDDYIRMTELHDYLEYRIARDE
jgi:hypothetical protein